jgi:hypothetical protein
MCNSIFVVEEKVVTVKHSSLFQAYELSAAQKENEKLKEDLSSREIKVKWAQNKLRTELDAHKVVVCNNLYNFFRKWKSEDIQYIIVIASNSTCFMYNVP